MPAASRLLAAVLLLATCSPAYYHFTHFATKTAPFRPIYERFDLNSLPNRTLNYFVEDGSRVQFAPNDSFPALLSQIRMAARVWNSVETSDLRVAFGGIAPRGQSSGPAMEILFDEVPPGIVAYGGPTVRAESNGTFIPVLRSVVVVQTDLSKRPSYTEALFGTLVHEIGHALGLQHALTSSVMSTATTRSTSKARPLAADDIAGISVLYPRANFAGSTGSISGRVVLQNGTPVNLASVVAIAPNGAAVSALTNPDGTYRIDGLAPRGYLVYVHPLPPPREGQATPADIVYPLDPDGRALPVGAPFETVFYGANGAVVRDPALAQSVSAPAGVVTENINFSVRQRTGYGVHSVETYAFPGNFAVKPPYLSPGTLRPFVVATGSGLTANNAPVAGLAASIIGGGALGVRPYVSAPASWVQLDLNQQLLLIASDTARHVVLSTPSDIYVLPSAFFHVERPAPQILSVAAAPEIGPRAAVLLGTNLLADTRVLFDGVEAATRSLEEVSPGLLRLVATAPAAAPGHRAVVTALNSDGQSSLFVQNDAPPTWTYAADAASPAVALTPNSLPSGAEATVQIDALNTQFAEGQVAVGFGSADVTVRRVWVVSPTRLLVNVAVAPGAQPSVFNVTIASGLQLITAPASFIAQGPQPRSFWLSSSYTNASTGQPSVSAGSVVTMTVGGTPVALTSSNTSVFLGDTRLAAPIVNGNQITFQIPSTTPAGPAAIRIEAGGERTLPMTIGIEVSTLRINSAVWGAGGATPVVLLEVSNLDDKPAAVTANGKDSKVLQSWRDGDKFRVLIELPENSPAGTKISLIVTSEGRTSDPYSLTIGG